MKKILSLVLVCVLMLGCVFTLASCGGPNADPEKAKAALEDAEYKVTYLEGDLLAMAPIDGLEAAINAIKDKDLVSIYYFEDKAAAADYYEELEKEYEELKEEAKEADEEFDYAIGKSGKMVWAGTKDAIKAAK